MKLRIKHVDVSQCGKMLAAIYFVISLPIIVGLILVALASGQAKIGIAALIVLPFVYALFSYLAGLISAWIYNLVAARLGGFEYTTAEIAS